MALLRRAFEEHSVSLLSYCLMPNHFHLLVGTGESPIGAAMHHLLTRYALYYNRNCGRVGHLFQGRFGARECGDLAYLLQLLWYLPINPVRAGLVSHPREWPWSSHDELVGGSARAIDVRRLSEVSGLGLEEIRQEYVDRLEGRHQNQKSGLGGIIERIALATGLRAEDIQAGYRRGAYTKAKRLIVEDGLREGYTLVEISRALGCTPAALSLLRRRLT